MLYPAKFKRKVISYIYYLLNIVKYKKLVKLTNLIFEEEEIILTSPIKQEESKVPIITNPKIKCGIVMPIASIEDCSEQHWKDVKNIIIESTNSIDEYDISIDLVSESDEIGVILKRIVQNIYDNDLIICDVSCLNPNVMFELGLRLAFDKPTVIIKDDDTKFSFDISVIEHLTYPRSLHYTGIQQFKITLAQKIKQTYEHYSTNKTDSPYLKHFREIKPSSIETEEVSENIALFKMISDLSEEVRMLRMDTKQNERQSNLRKTKLKDIKNYELDKNINAKIISWINKYCKENKILPYQLKLSDSLLKKIVSDLSLYNYFEDENELYLYCRKLVHDEMPPF